MRTRILLTTLLLTAVAFAGCASDEEGSASTAAGGPGETLTVNMADSMYDPKELRVKAGTTVQWVNKDEIGHTVTPDSSTQWGTPGSGDAPDSWLTGGETWSWTFDKPGTYAYHCIPHATKAGTGYLGMAGTIIVE